MSVAYQCSAAVLSDPDNDLLLDEKEVHTVHATWFSPDGKDKLEAPQQELKFTGNGTGRFWSLARAAQAAGGSAGRVAGPLARFVKAHRLRGPAASVNVHIGAHEVGRGEWG